MKKLQLIWPSILYKRPVSKAGSLYNSINSKYNSTKPDLNANSTEEDQKENNNKIIENINTETNKQKLKCLYSNFNNFKKMKVNYPLCKTGRYSEKLKNKSKKNINEIKNNNSLFNIRKENDNKIYPNINNNTCNISLNQHFYNIDYNNFASTNSLIKKDILDNNNSTERAKNQPKFNVNNNIKKSHNNININNNKGNKNNIYINSFSKNFPIHVMKEINNSYDSFDNNSNTILIKNNYKKKKKQNIINLFVNPNNQFYDLNKTSDLNDYSNFVKLFTQRRLKNKLNQTNNFEKDNYINQTTSIDNNFKYQKKIISHNSFIKKNENISNHSLPKNNNNFFGKIGNLKYKRHINVNQISNQYSDLNSHYFKLNDINYTKKSDSKNLSEKKKLSSSISTLKATLNHSRINFKKNAINNLMLKSNSILRKNSEKNKNQNQKKKILINLKKESTKDFKEKLNTTKPDNSCKKRIIEFPNNKKKLKKINLNKLINGAKKNKMNISPINNKKNFFNLKKIFTEHFSTEENRIIYNNNNLSSYRTNNLSQNKNLKNINYIKVKPKKISLNKEKIVNKNLRDVLNKFRQVKTKIGKKSDSNRNKNKNQLNKTTNIIINKNDKDNEKKIEENSPKLKLELSQELSESNSTKSNEYMDQSKKLSEYIKDFYLKNNKYPQTNLNFYRIGKVIGQGGFAKVNLGLNVLTGRVVAIKSFNKNIKTKHGDKINMDKIIYEINLMRKLNHQNITKILETFEDDQFYFIIMEYINGGNLFSYVKKRRKLSEKVAKFLFRQIILGINHIHSNLIVHRDIKLENILIDMNNNIKICDFGIGIILSSENQILYSHCGTPMYIAPEIITSTKEKGYKGFPVDIWSAGIALYIMVSGRLPFNFEESPYDFNVMNQNKDMNKEKNMKLKYEIVNKEPKHLDNISNELRDLLKGLLNKDPKKRLNCEQILNHPWLNDVNITKVNLYSKKERHLLYKTYIDYRKRKADELIENFTLSNLFKDEKQSDEKYNCETKSSLLAPFNSINYEYFKIENPKNKKDEFEDFNNDKLWVENDLFTFSNKAKEFNYQYELDNNKEVDNGVLINNKSINESSSSSFSNANSKRNLFNDKFINFNSDFNDVENIAEYKKENILTQIENLGYDRDYVVKSLKKNFLNHASTVYFLLRNYEDI